MAFTKEQRIINAVSGSTKQQRNPKTSGQSYEPKTPIATGMYLPNHSGIASHPEAKENFVTIATDQTITSNKTITNSAGATVTPLTITDNSSLTDPCFKIESTAARASGKEVWDIHASGTVTDGTVGKFRADNLNGVGTLMQIEYSATDASPNALQISAPSGKAINIQNGSINLEAGAGNIIMGDHSITGIDTLAFTDTAGTIAGIQNQNLLDKTANETVSGTWNFTPKTHFNAGVALDDSASANVVTILQSDEQSGTSTAVLPSIADATENIFAMLEQTQSFTGTNTFTGKTVFTNAGSDTVEIKATTANNVACQIVDGVTDTIRIGSFAGTPAILANQNSLGIGAASLGALITFSSTAVALAGTTGSLTFTTLSNLSTTSNHTGTSNFGDAGVTNYAQFSTTGDLLFNGSAGLAYAEIYANDVNTTITTSATPGQANKVQVTAFDTNGASNNMTPDQVNDHITADYAGHYLATVSISIDSVTGSAAEFAFSLYKNNGATEFPNVSVKRDLAAGAGGNHASLSMSGIIDLDANDTVELFCWNNTNAQNIVVDNVTMSLVQIGGT